MSESFRYDYDLTPASRVFDVGAYECGFARDIHAKFGCRVDAFEAVPEFCANIRNSNIPKGIFLFDFGIGYPERRAKIAIRNNSSSLYLPSDRYEEIEIRDLKNVMRGLELDEVDLLKLNIEGEEIPLLENVLDEDYADSFRDIQCQFHNWVPDAERRRDRIREGLSKTHALTYDYPWVWENWRRK